MTIDFSKKAMVAYLTAGYPDMDFTAKAMLAMQKAGASAIELGVPYSDPVSDGPVIAEASLLSLEKGTNLDAIFDMLESIKNKLKIPVYLMSYYAPLYAYGETRLISRAKSSGASGFVFPDITVEEGGEMFANVKASGLDAILLVYPNTPEERVRRISEAGGSFLYYVNLFGTTGARKELPESSLETLAKVKKWSSKPVCAGFGVSDRSMFEKLAAKCDGVIIGSAIVRILLENRDDKKKALQGIEEFVRSITGTAQ
jgi:tryptophan synthase alpha chain